MATNENSVKVCRLLVVGMNRTRLAKIMTLLNSSKHEAEEENYAEPLDATAQIEIDYIPCIATMRTYEAENAREVRYLNSFNHYDGSAMTKFFDDEIVRPTLTALAMIGYEWNFSDKEKLENYLSTNQISLLFLECVQPSSCLGFLTLEEEMRYFKGLDEDSKAQHIDNQTMGPGKMAKFVLDLAGRVKLSKQKELRESTKLKKLTVQTTTTSGMSDPNADTPDVVNHEIEPFSPMQRQQMPDPTTTRFACRMCRHVLFGQDDLADNHIQNLHSFRRANYGKTRPTMACQSIFCKEQTLEWLSPHGQDMEGKLLCPKCSSKIGHWRWSGAQCSCGTWVTPAIQVPTSKVDTIQPIVTLNAVAPAAWK